MPVCRPAATTALRRAIRRAAARAVDRVGEQCGDVGAGAGGLIELGGQPRPERVGDDVGVDAFGEAAPALCAGLAAAQRGVDAAVDELLDRRRAVGVLFGAGDAGVGGIDVVGGAEHRDLGHQLWLLASSGRAQAGAVRVAIARCCADLLGQFGDELGARVQVGAPLRVCGEASGMAGSQRSGPTRSAASLAVAAVASRAPRRRRWGCQRGGGGRCRASIGSWPSMASRARLRRSTGQAAQSVRLARIATAAASMWAMVAAPAVFSAAR